MYQYTNIIFFSDHRDAEVVDQLLTAAKHALYLLQNSSLTHDYAYIHCSTWKLAQSVLDLSKNFSKSANAERCEVGDAVEIIYSC